MQGPHSNSVSTATSTSEYETGPDSSGPRTCVLLRGLIRSRFHWGNFPVELLKLAPVEELLMPELAGNGERSTEHSPADIAAMVEDMRRQTLELKPDGLNNLTLIAISMGAMIATAWAAKYPDEVAELHLINTSFGRFSRPWQRMKPRALARLLKLAPKLLQDPAALESGILDMTLNHTPPPHCLAEWKQFARQHPMSASNIIHQIQAAGGYQGPANAPCERTYLYCSANDQLVSSQCSHAIAKAWGKPLFEHPSAGHDLPMDDGEWLVSSIERALGTL